MHLFIWKARGRERMTLWSSSLFPQMSVTTRSGPKSGASNSAWFSLWVSGTQATGLVLPACSGTLLGNWILSKVAGTWNRAQCGMSIVIYWSFYCHLCFDFYCVECQFSWSVSDFKSLFPYTLFCKMLQSLLWFCLCLCCALNIQSTTKDEHCNKFFSQESVEVHFEVNS